MRQFDFQGVATEARKISIEIAFEVSRERKLMAIELFNSISKFDKESYCNALNLLTIK